MIRQEITKERYFELMEMDRKTQRSSILANEVTEEMHNGYGWYGYILYQMGDKYYIKHKTGSTCD